MGGGLARGDRGLSMAMSSVSIVESEAGECDVGVGAGEDSAQTGSRGNKQWV